MFLFIEEKKDGKSKKSEFQYISCSYLSIVGLHNTTHRGNFNTSHVLIYLSVRTSCMLGFGNFNTSHVLIYRDSRLFNTGDRSNFNTSHVLIYPVGRYSPIITSNFNTSHVLIYRLLNSTFYHKMAFQYISCSYLS